MNRSLTWLAGPELALGVVTGFVFLVCARYNSYSSGDGRVLERFLWLLPLMAVPVAFATLFVPGAKTWWWLGRVNLAVLLCLVVCGLRIVAGFGAPGSGPKGQDVGLIVIVALGVLFSALGNAVAGALILRAQHPGFDEWFRIRTVLAPTLMVLAAVPVAIAQAVVTSLVLGIAGAIYSEFSR